MTYTPVELRHVKVGRSPFGYNRAAVEQLIEEVAQSFEATWRERSELADRVEALEKEVVEQQQRADLLTQTLVAAERAASDVRERARLEAEAIISEAHVEARAIGRTAHSQHEQLIAETRRIQSMLRAALGVIEEGTSRLGVPAPGSRGEVDVPSRAFEEAPGPPVPVGPEPGEGFARRPLLPPVITDSPVDGWREDTREFEPIVLRPVDATPAAGIEEEPEPEESLAPAQELPPAHALQPMPGRESRDFDWGE
jgi:hypothetical protein